MHHVADTSLSPAEKEEKQVERLINKKPPPSRKYTEKRGPKHDNRRERMNTEDSDVSSKDSDMSLASIASKLSDTAASYRTEPVRMLKTSAYHGVLQQGHPSGPTNTEYKSYDKRYFGKDNYDNIIAATKSFLEEDWLKHGWDGGSPDAPIRAALDLAIHLANSNLYQSKIDAATYDMLLNKVAGWKHDQFSETIFPGERKRSASMNDSNIQTFLRIASDLRHSNPRAAADIVKTIRNLRASDHGQDSDQSPPSQQAGISEVDMNKFVSGELDIQELKDETKKLVDSSDIESFLSGLKDISEILGKRASRIASIDEASFEDIQESLDAMSGDQSKTVMDKIVGQSKDLLKSLESNDIEAFMSGIDSIFSEVEKAAKNIKTSSVMVNLSTLVRLASSVPDSRDILLPILAAAKKKKDKKKAPKKAAPKKDKKDKKDKNKDVPFGGKKAPPFGKKKNASVDVLTTDSEW